MFDCLEESYNPFEEQVFLIKVVKNKKRQKKKIYYLKTIGQGDKILWTPKMEESMRLLLISPSYTIVREAVRKSGISCQILRVPYIDFLKPTIIGNKPVRKVKWWGRFKVWFSRKVIEFMTLPVDSSLPGED